MCIRDRPVCRHHPGEVGRDHAAHVALPPVRAAEPVAQFGAVCLLARVWTRRDAAAGFAADLDGECGMGEIHHPTGQEGFAIRTRIGMRKALAQACLLYTSRCV